MQDLNLRAVVETACDGHELLNVLDKTAERLPDMIFLDINMPLKNGFDCLEEIRSRKDALEEVKIIMFSTSKNQDNIDLSYQLGADFYAVKPSSFQGLKNFFKKYLKLNGAVLKNAAINSFLPKLYTLIYTCRNYNLSFWNMQLI